MVHCVCEDNTKTKPMLNSEFNTEVPDVLVHACYFSTLGAEAVRSEVQMSFSATEKFNASLGDK